MIYNPEMRKSFDSLLNSFHKDLFDEAMKLGGELGGKETFEQLMKRLETFLMEAGVELTPVQKKELRGYLAEYGAQIAWPEFIQERIPTQEEVKQVFEKLLGIKGYEELKKKEDENGLYLWNVIIKGEKEDIEYSYIRKGNYPPPDGSPLETAVHTWISDKDGMPLGVVQQQNLLTENGN